jgi:hypothetical protein
MADPPWRERMFNLEHLADTEEKVEDDNIEKSQLNVFFERLGLFKVIFFFYPQHRVRVFSSFEIPGNRTTWRARNLAWVIKVCGLS